MAMFAKLRFKVYLVGASQDTSARFVKLGLTLRLVTLVGAISKKKRYKI